jgi:MYXO-CTERM domain-containing protein
MNKRDLSLALVTSLAAFSPLAIVRSAAACSPPPCSDVVALPHADARIPANLVRFQVLVPDPGPLELRTAAGAVIPASVKTMGKDRVFSPDQAVPADTALELHHRARCTFDLPVPQQVYRFRTVAPESLELRRPELAVQEIGLRYPGDDHNERIYTRLRLYAADASGAAHTLLRHSVTIDGRPHGFEQGQSWDDAIIEVGSRCRPASPDWHIDTCGGIDSVPPGLHEVRVKTHVLGETTAVEDVVATVDTRCDSLIVRSPPGPAPDAGVTADAGVTVGRQDFKDLPTEGGCSVGGAGAASGAGWMTAGLVGLALAVTRRRKRAER